MSYRQKRDISQILWGHPGGRVHPYPKRRHFDKMYNKRITTFKKMPRLNKNDKTMAKKMTYWNEVVGSALAAGAGIHLLQVANDITTSQQPMGRDQLFGYYSRAYVKGCKVTLQIGCSSSAIKIHHCSWFDKVATAPTNASDAIERCKSFGGSFMTSYATYPGTNSTHGKVSSATSTFAMNHNGMDEPDNYCDSANAPGASAQYYWHGYIFNSSTANIDAGGNGVSYNYLMEFDVIWTEPKIIAVS